MAVGIRLLLLLSLIVGHGHRRCGFHVPAGELADLVVNGDGLAVLIAGMASGSKPRFGSGHDLPSRAIDSI
jgi:hypothetical protein